MAGVLRALVGMWEAAVLHMKEDVVGIPEERILSQENKDAHNGGLVTCKEQVKSTML